MSKWSQEELEQIKKTDDLHISPFREDGTTYGTPTWIWSVVVDDAVYVRPYNGKTSRWFKAALSQKSGRITAAGITKEVKFELAENDIFDRVDQAYESKYSKSEYLALMIGSPIRLNTVRILPLK
ncbi:unnamed protein product [Sphagnum balticum]